MRSKAGKISISSSLSLAVAIAQKSEEIPNPEVLYSWMTPFSQAAMLISDLIQNIPKPKRVGLAKTCIELSSTLDFKLEVFWWLKREDESKPEKDAFSEDCIDDIGKHLGKILSEILEQTEDITKLTSKSIPKIFYTLNKYVRNNYVNDYVAGLISTDPVAIVRILDSYVPTAWGMESGVSHKSDFEREQYNSLTGELDASIILDSVQEHFPQVMDVSDDFPRLYDADANKELIFVEQFVWLHKYVLRESKPDEESHEGEEKT